MSQSRLTYLLKRHFDDMATADELDEMMLYIDKAEYEEEIKLQMDLFWRENQASSPFFSDEMSKSMLNKILVPRQLQQIHPHRKKQEWYYVAAAAMVLLLGTFVYKAAFQKDKPQGLVESIKIPADISPGGYKAVLTLADRSTIILDSAANGLLVQQGNANIFKQSDGQLAYIPTIGEPGGMISNCITTPRGGQYRLTLSDGSRVWLNAASSLKFPPLFEGAERRVEIFGEAYFEVAKNNSKPFIVNVAGKGEVMVMGTHFNICAYSDEGPVKTTLLEGIVKVTNTSSGSSKIIYPGDQALVNQNGQLSLNKNVDTAQVVAWKSGFFNFSGADIAMVLRQLSRWYDVDIVFEGSLPQRKFEGELQRNLSLSQVIRLLERNDVHFRMDGKKLIVLK